MNYNKIVSIKWHQFYPYLNCVILFIQSHHDINGWPILSSRERTTKPISQDMSVVPVWAHCTRAQKIMPSSAAQYSLLCHEGEINSHQEIELHTHKANSHAKALMHYTKSQYQFSFPFTSASLKKFPTQICYFQSNPTQILCNISTELSPLENQMIFKLASSICLFKAA